MPDLWPRIKVEIAKRRDGAGREEEWLAAKLETSVQAVHNWTTRGIPPARHAAIAQALGWTVDFLVNEKPQSHSDAWPFDAALRERFDALTERERGVVENAMIEAIEKIEARKHESTPSSKRANGV